MIASHPRLKEHSKLLIIPGPDDAGIDIVNKLITPRLLIFFPGPSTALPRCALPNYLTEELQSTSLMPYFQATPAG